MGPKRDLAAEAEEARLLAEEEARQAAEAERKRKLEERLGNTLCFKDLDEAFTKQVLACTDPADLLVQLGVKLGIHDYRENIRSNVLVDFHLGTLLFAKESGMNEEQTSALYSIMLRTHETGLREKLSMKEAFSSFKTLMLKHSLRNPPTHTDIFTPEQVELTTAFATKVYFQHYEAYHFVFTQEQARDQHSTELFVQTSMVPPPLASYVTSSMDEVVAVAKPEEKLAEAAEPAAAAAPEPAPFATADGTVIPAELIEKMVAASVAMEIQKLKAELTSSLKAQDAQILEKIKKLGTA